MCTVSLLIDLVTDEQVLELRSMTEEPEYTGAEDCDAYIYTDTDLKKIIASYPMRDVLGKKPCSINLATIPPSFTLNTYWIPTFDLNRAAAKIWLDKAGRVARRFAYSADGASFSPNQQYKHYQEQYRIYWARRAPRTVEVLVPDTTESDLVISSDVVNL